MGCEDNINRFSLTLSAGIIRRRHWLRQTGEIYYGCFGYSTIITRFRCVLEKAVAEATGLEFFRPSRFTFRAHRPLRRSKPLMAPPRRRRSLLMISDRISGITNSRMDVVTLSSEDG